MFSLMQKSETHHPLNSPAQLVCFNHIARPQSDRITPVIRTDMIEIPWPPYVAE
jgi:hypothetical protein